MTPQQKIEALARMEGIKVRPYKSFSEVPIGVPLGEGRFSWNLPHYLTSHDALQPLLEMMTEGEWKEFYWYATNDLSEDVLWEEYEVGKHLLQLTPEQKADCILKACGKWEE